MTCADSVDFPFLVAYMLTPHGSGSFFILLLNLPSVYKVQYISLITNICPFIESPSVHLQLDCVCCEVMSPTSDLIAMSNSTLNNSFRFAKLSGSNYTEWATNMKSTLQLKYLWLITDGRESCPSEPPEELVVDMPAAELRAIRKEYLTWHLQDEVAQGFMKGAAEPLQWPHVSKCHSAKEMWDTWKKIHVNNQQKINVHYFFEELL